MLTIVIPTYNGLHHLQDCLASLQTQTRRDFETIVVDNHSSDGTCEFLRDHYPEIRVIRLPCNRGFAPAVNRGLEAARGEFIALLNNDTVVEPGWLEALVNKLMQEPNLGACSSLLLLASPAGAVDTIGDGFTIAGFSYKIGWLEAEGPQHQIERRVFGACGGAALYRRKLLQQIGLLDESYFAFIEDGDLAFRAQLAGAQTAYVPAARVHHKLRATAGQGSPLSEFLCYRNQTMMTLKDFPLGLLILYSPHILLHTAVVLLRFLVKGGLWTVLRAYLAAFREWPTIMRERKFVHARRVVPIRGLRQQLTGNWLAIHYRFSTSLRRLVRRK